MAFAVTHAFVIEASHRQERQMRSTRTRSVLLVTALSVAAFALQTETADAAAKRTHQRPKRPWQAHASGATACPSR
jgi:hypothetical protein